MRVIEGVRKAVKDLKANEPIEAIEIGGFAFEGLKLEAGLPMTRPNPTTLLGIPVIVNDAMPPDTIALVGPSNGIDPPKVVVLKL